MNQDQLYMHLGQRGSNVLHPLEPAGSQARQLVSLELSHQLGDMSGRREHETRLADVDGAIGPGRCINTFKPGLMEPEDILSGKAMIAVKAGHGFIHQTPEPLLFDMLHFLLTRNAEQVAQYRTV